MLELNDGACIVPVTIGITENRLRLPGDLLLIMLLMLCVYLKLRLCSGVLIRLALSCNSSYLQKNASKSYKFEIAYPELLEFFLRVFLGIEGFNFWARIGLNENVSYLV